MSQTDSQPVERILIYEKGGLEYGLLVRGFDEQPAPRLGLRWRQFRAVDAVAPAGVMTQFLACFDSARTTQPPILRVQNRQGEVLQQIYNAEITGCGARCSGNGITIATDVCFIGYVDATPTPAPEPPTVTPEQQSIVREALVAFEQLCRPNCISVMRFVTFGQHTVTMHLGTPDPDALRSYLQGQKAVSPEKPAADPVGDFWRIE